MLALLVAATSMLFGAYYALKTRLAELEGNVRELQQRLATAERKLDNRDRTPIATVSEAPPVVRPAESVGEPSAHTRAPDIVEPLGEEAGSPPTAKNPPDTVVCVDKRTHAIFACENAANCLGPKSFDATYFNNMRARLGITNAMMICSMKSPNNGAAPESN